MTHASRALLCALLLSPLVGCETQTPPPTEVVVTTTPEETPTPTPTQAPTAGALGAVPVGDEHPAGYTREAFGPPWRVDLDGNGCTAQQDVLRRDLTDVTVRGRCTVTSGWLVDPYTGQRVRYVRGGPSEVDVDHVTALAEAWRSGAWQWTAEQRAQFASDPTNLLATASSVNRAKGDDDGTWTADGRTLPIGAERGCRYARIVVAVKAAHQLSADPAERAELAPLLAGCP